MREPLTIRLYRRVLSTTPAPFRTTYAQEAAATLAELLAAERTRGGRWAAHRTWLRAMADAVRTTRRERSLSGLTKGGGVITGISDDFKYVWRSWRRAKAFAWTSVLTVGLGLGLNAGIFSFADGFLFRSLPFNEPDRLFRLGENETVSGGLNLDDYEQIQRELPGVAGMAEWDVGRFVRTDTAEVGDRWVSVFAYQVSPRFEDVMGFRLFRGRGFRDDEHRDMPVTPCWASYAFWRGALRSDPLAVGRRLRTRLSSGEPAGDLQIVGILPALVASFDLNNTPPDIVVPAVPRVVPSQMRRLTSAYPIVRIAENLTPAQALERLQATVSAVQAQTPGGKARHIVMRSLSETQVKGGRPTAILLFAVASAILLLVVVNFSHLLLARIVARSSEIAMRLALGASRWRVARLFLVESFSVTATGGVVGLGLGWMFSALLRATVPQFPSGPRNMSLVPMSFDVRVGIYTAILVATIAALTALLPALRYSVSTDGRLARVLSSIRDGVSGRASRAILMVEVSLATVIMSGTLLVGVSAWHFLHKPLGFDPSDRVEFGIDMPGIAPPAAAAALTRKAEIHAALAALPGVTAVGFSGLAGGATEPVTVDGQTLRLNAAATRRVDAEYFDALGLRRLAGRSFTASEGESDAPVAVIEDGLAARLWPGNDPLGRTISSGGKGRTVIGVVAHARWRLSEDTSQTVYVPLDPARMAFDGIIRWPGASDEQAHQLVQRVGATIAPGADAWARTVFERIALRDAGESRFQGPIVAVLGTVAFLLTSVGLYGLVTYLVEQRLREFGVRLALGARAQDLWPAVLRQSLVPTIFGVVVGLGLAIWTAHFLRAVLFGVEETSPTLLGVVAASLIGAAAAACARPANRVLHIDPVRVLRAE
jgi:predicted permease